MQSLSSYLPLGAARPRTQATSQVGSAEGMQDLPYSVQRNNTVLGRPLHAGAACPAVACHGTFGVALAMSIAAMLTSGSHRNSSSKGG